ncbi:MAG: hypothetical protein ABI972_01195 [Acidobacteriota bacterium]
MRLLAALVVSTLAAADLKSPRTEPNHFPVQATDGSLTIAAEYLVRGLPAEKQVFFVRDFLVVEVALFPAKGTEATVKNTAFALRLNNEKIPLQPATPGMVAAAFKYDDWTQRPTVEATAGVGDTGVTIGRPQRSERFPGDPTPQQRRLPNPPRVEDQTDRSGVERAPEEKPEEAAVSLALPEETISGPTRGYLYFPYAGKTKSIKKAALLYRGVKGEVTLNLK